MPVKVKAVKWKLFGHVSAQTGVMVFLPNHQWGDTRQRGKGRQQPLLLEEPRNEQHDRSAESATVCGRRELRRGVARWWAERS